jgi:hypothetical protein
MQVPKEAKVGCKSARPNSVESADEQHNQRANQRAYRAKRARVHKQLLCMSFPVKTKIRISAGIPDESPGLVVQTSRGGVGKTRSHNKQGPLKIFVSGIRYLYNLTVHTLNHSTPYLSDVLIFEFSAFSTGLVLKEYN